MAFWRGQKPAEPCKGGCFAQRLLSTHGRLNSVGASGKRLVFFEGGCCDLEGPCLLGLRPNFDGLGWVRLKVSNS